MKEGPEGQDMDGFITTLLREAPEINVDDWYEVDRAHRVGPPPSDTSRP